MTDSNNLITKVIVTYVEEYMLQIKYITYILEFKIKGSWELKYYPITYLKKIFHKKLFLKIF